MKGDRRWWNDGRLDRECEALRASRWPDEVDGAISRLACDTEHCRRDLTEFAQVLARLGLEPPHHAALLSAAVLLADATKRDPQHVVATVAALARAMLAGELQPTCVRGPGGERCELLLSAPGQSGQGVRLAWWDTVDLALDPAPARHVLCCMYDCTEARVRATRMLLLGDPEPLTWKPVCPDHVDCWEDERHRVHEVRDLESEAQLQDANEALFLSRFVRL